MKPEKFFTGFWDADFARTWRNCCLKMLKKFLTLSSKKSDCSDFLLFRQIFGLLCKFVHFFGKFLGIDEVFGLIFDIFGFVLDFACGLGHMICQVGFVFVKEL